MYRITDEVVNLDCEKKMTSLKSGKAVSYDRLLIASGSVARMTDWPGQDLDGVGNFVPWQNMEWLKDKMKTAKRACVVGGGLIGIEVAEVLLQAGIETSFLIREDISWPVALDENESKLIVNQMLEMTAKPIEHIKDFDYQKFVSRRIKTANHCYGCTAGSGSSCGGELAPVEIAVKGK